ncbi:hypothetical protein N7582_000662 [Saccharomyces uvarum]|uniref:Dynein intermediate chain n=1 Tax=Saccharomyces uvarum TaxID=230603 RepID=A0AA35NQ60_SACUV|nr:hypothetical protein N7582_000662 [Saccharomyces uvarum]CAI4056622.1 hypothetical protein SUVC_02G5950 [Saccharomyces uvarum]
MERLKELEEKRRQLKELRERRKQATVLTGERVLTASARGQQPATAAMVSVSVQTDIEEEGTARGPEPAYHRRKEVITYDKGVQTEQIERDLEQEDDSAAAVDTVIVENSSEVEDVHARLELAKPVVVEDAAATLNDASFARLETFAPGAGEQPVPEQQDRHGPMQWAMVSENVPADSDCECVAQEHDPSKGILVVAYVRLPPAARRYASDETAWSVVNVVKCDSASGRNGQLVDLVEFRGTRVVGATILRRDHHESQVVSILLATSTGKTTLYELRLKQKHAAPAAYVVQRNMIARHYFQHPVVAVLETSSVRGQERVLVAADDGTIAELSCLDLSVLRAPRRLRPVPLSRLLALEAQDESSAYSQRLKRLAKFDEVGVACVAYTREDPQHVWVGAEDGGIYKVDWDQPGPLCLALDNNGFQPVESHSTRVTGLEFYQDDARRLMLLLSCSTDWTVRLWDARAGEAAAAGAPLQLGAPVLGARWLGAAADGGRSLRCSVWCADGRHVIAEWVFDRDSSLYTAVIIS